MNFSIHHVTKFSYDAPITESVMELRMQPRSEGSQRLLKFDLSLRPSARLASYQDHLGNTVHHFDIPAQHRQLVITAKTLIEMQTLAPLPTRSTRLPGASWTCW